MLAKGDLKKVLLTAAAVIIAGGVMYFLQDLPGIKEARKGFDS